ncbi:hypothetical protein [Halobaculum sp. EA56]|uniref:hypothetical protein n=1 Tax=Halobaculum sp. EA56 TaxID=3421648 RepID=UPI003EB9BA27
MVVGPPGPDIFGLIAEKFPNHMLIGPRDHKPHTPVIVGPKASPDIGNPQIQLLARFLSPIASPAELLDVGWLVLGKEFLLQLAVGLQPFVRLLEMRLPLIKLVQQD